MKKEWRNDESAAGAGGILNRGLPRAMAPGGVIPGRWAALPGRPGVAVRLTTAQDQRRAHSLRPDSGAHGVVAVVWDSAKAITARGSFFSPFHRQPGSALLSLACQKRMYVMPLDALSFY